MEQAHPQQDTEKPLKELRFNAHDPLLKDSLMLMHAQGEKAIYQNSFAAENAYLFSRPKMRRDTSDRVFHHSAEGYSLNNSIFSRYEMNAIDVSRRGLKNFRLGTEISTRTVLGARSSGHYIDMEIILDGQDIKRLLTQPLVGPLNHHLPASEEVVARDIRENRQMTAMIERGRLPVTYEVDHMVENDNNRAINRLYRVLKAGAYVSQLAIVPTKLTAARYTPIFTAPKTKKRPYANVSDIDSYIDHTYGLERGGWADVHDINKNVDDHDHSIKDAG
ncbi:MAG TPA: hypothetical protein VIM37_02985 [Candidatus Microsaccharimonas sp.]|jgi:hypothetical protein